MITLEQAIRVDTTSTEIHGDALHVNVLRVLEAALLYEEVLRSSQATVESHLNLAVLYWTCTDYGFFATYGLSHEFVNLAEQRCRELLREARQRYGEVPEIGFWELYFDFASLGGEPFPDEARRLVMQPGSSLVPYFYLYSYGYLDALGHDYGEQAKALLTASEALPTTKNRWIAVIIRSAMKRRTDTDDSLAR